MALQCVLSDLGDYTRRARESQVCTPVKCAIKKRACSVTRRAGRRTGAPARPTAQRHAGNAGGTVGGMGALPGLEPGALGRGFMGGRDLPCPGAPHRWPQWRPICGLGAQALEWVCKRASLRVCRGAGKIADRAYRQGQTELGNRRGGAARGARRGGAARGARRGGRGAGARRGGRGAGGAARGRGAGARRGGRGAGARRGGAARGARRGGARRGGRGAGARRGGAARGARRGGAARGARRGGRKLPPPICEGNFRPLCALTAQRARPRYRVRRAPFGRHPTPRAGWDACLCRGWDAAMRLHRPSAGLKALA